MGSLLNVLFVFVKYSRWLSSIDIECSKCFLKDNASSLLITLIIELFKLLFISFACGVSSDEISCPTGGSILVVFE